jgi:hypothetical protein
MKSDILTENTPTFLILSRFFPVTRHEQRRLASNVVLTLLKFFASIYRAANILWTVIFALLKWYA